MLPTGEVWRTASCAFRSVLAVIAGSGRSSGAAGHAVHTKLGGKEREPLGTVYSHAVTHQAFVSSFADLVPYTQVLVELPHCDGRRLFGLLDGPSDGLAIGRAVEGIILAPTDRTLGLASLVWRLI